MLIIGALIGVAVAAATYATENVVDHKIQEHKAINAMRYDSDEFDDDDDVCDVCVDLSSNDDNDAPVERSDIFRSFRDSEEEIDTVEAEEISSDEDSDEADEEDDPEHPWRHGVTVKFKEHDLARTADGINQIKDCTYKFIRYNPDNPQTCFITRGSKQRVFEVLVGSLTVV